MQDRLLLANDREGDLDIAFDREEGPGPGLWLRPSQRYENAGVPWTPAPIASRWTADDLTRVAGWCSLSAVPGPRTRAPALWVATPPVGFLVIGREPGITAVDICWMEHPDTAPPRLTGKEAVARGGDDRFAYLTVDMLDEALASAADTWRAWAALR